MFIIWSAMLGILHLQNATRYWTPDIEINATGDVYTLVNSTLTLECTISEPRYAVAEKKWTHPPTERSVTSGRYYIERRRGRDIWRIRLTLTKARKEDSGLYKCKSRDQRGRWAYKKVNVFVTDPTEPYFPESNIISSGRILATPGEKVELLCLDVKGLPKPKMKWYRDGNLVNDTTTADVKFGYDNYKLIIPRFHRNDSGIYTCSAENDYGVVSRSIRLSEKEETSVMHLPVIPLVLVGVGLFAALTSVFIFGRKIYRHKKMLKKLELFDLKLFQEGQMTLFNPKESLQDQSELLPYDQAWEFPIDKLKLGKTLGQGAFGRVIKAEAIGLKDNEPSTTVAVKTPKGTVANVEHMKYLMSELKILIHLGQHVNIVNLVGAVTKLIGKGQLMVMVEYCKHGDLRNYLIKNRYFFFPESSLCVEKTNHGRHYENIPSLHDDSMGDRNFPHLPTVAFHQRLLPSSDSSAQSPSYGHNRTDVTICSSASSAYGSTGFSRRGHRKDPYVTTADLICFSFQCARAMEYLSLRKIIHRDLAARNVLLAAGSVVKICDFGLAKDIYRYDNYIREGNGPLPIMWMALESIVDKLFTIKSDVWSFGVLLWEIFSLGRTPYPGEEMNINFTKRLEQGLRLDQPLDAPNVIYQLMRNCWRRSPAHRPDFAQLVGVLADLLKPEVKQHFINLNESYEKSNKNYRYLRGSQNEEEAQSSVVLGDTAVSSSQDHADVPHVETTTNDSCQQSSVDVEAVIHTCRDENGIKILKVPGTGNTDEPSYSAGFTNMDSECLNEPYQTVSHESPNGHGLSVDT